MCCDFTVLIFNGMSVVYCLKSILSLLVHLGKDKLLCTVCCGQLLDPKLPVDHMVGGFYQCWSNIGPTVS